MRRERGLTMIETMTAVALLGGLCIAVGGLALDAKRTSDLGAAYALDVSETRRALGAVEDDLRAASEVRIEPAKLFVSRDGADVRWMLEGTSLRRDGVVLARNVATFDATQDGACVRVAVALGRRSPDARRTARVETVVHPRAIRETPR